MKPGRTGSLIQELRTKHSPLRIKMSKKPDTIDKLLNIDHNNRVITQKRELNPHHLMLVLELKLEKSIPIMN
jgi:hypothetical protein